MSNMNRPKSATMEDWMLKQTRFVGNVYITTNATPALKVVSSDVSNILIARTEGLTAQADAVENLSSQVSGAATDSTGVFAILLDEQVDQILKCTVTPSTGTVAVTTAITTGGRLLINCDSNQNFASTSVNFLVELEYHTTK